MDTPQLSRIDTRARVSAVSRSDEVHADVHREFTALLVGEEAARRRHGSDVDEEADGHSAAAVAETPHPSADSVIEPQSPAEADEMLPEDAHDPQELCALLAASTTDC
jgi:hypothetical protein